MGLDMYLEKRIYIGASYDFNNVKGTVYITKDNKEVPINFKKIDSIIERVGYWRKANQIHRWFVENIQDGNDDCKEYWVPAHKLHELYNICKKVLRNHKLAPELLPTQSGFFFGGTDYDEYYFEDIKQTIDILKPVIKETSTDEYVGDFYYSSSW